MNDRVIRIVKVIISLVLMYVLLNQIEYEEIKTVVENIKIGSVFLAVIIYNISVIINAVKWKILLPKVRISYLVYLCFRAQFYSIVLPGQLFGEASKLTVWKDEEEDIARVTASVVYDKITGIIGQMIIAVVGFSFSIMGENSIDKWWLLGGIIVILAVIFFSTERHIAQFINNIINVITKKKDAFGSKLKELYSAWFFFSKSRKTLFLSIVWGSINQIVGSIMIFYLSKMIGLEVGFFEYCWIMPMISLILLIPISFAGIGLRDASLTSVLALFNVPSSNALVLSSSLLLGQIAAAAIGSGLILVSYIKDKQGK